MKLFYVKSTRRDRKSSLKLNAKDEGKTFLEDDQEQEKLLYRPRVLRREPKQKYEKRIAKLSGSFVQKIV